MSTAAEQTLTEALAEIGVENIASALPNYRWLYAGDAYLGAYDAPQGWALVHQAQAAA